MSAVSDFLRQPLAFLENNILMMRLNGMSKAIDQPRTPLFMAAFHPPSGVMPKQGSDGERNDIPVWELVLASTSDEYFGAYWCPFKADGTGMTTIWNQADYMFTYRMDGCTFRAAPPSQDGARFCAHTNAVSRGNAQGKDAQYDRQLAMAVAATGAINGDSKGLLKPETYRDRKGFDGCDSTTIGIRNPGDHTWKFYAHVTQIDASVGVRLIEPHLEF